MAVHFQDLIPMLICEDVPASIDFYTEALGFTVTGRDDSLGRSGWASLNNGPLQLMLASLDSGSAPVKVDGHYPQSIYYFYPEDVEALHADLRAKGYAVSDLRVAFYGLKEFDLVDPNGHVLWFGQETEDEPTLKEG